MRATRFRAITLAAPDPALLAEFYGTTLGLPVRFDEAIAIVRAGSTELRFEPGEGAPFYHFAFNIPSNRIQHARVWLSERVDLLRYVETGEEVVAFETWNAHSVYFHDLAGNIVELIARHGLANDDATTAAFGPASILGLSEIALAVEDVPATVRELGSVLGLPVYGGGDEVFTALGDERGLVLAIRAGWPWLPEKSRVAEPHPVRLEVERTPGTALGAVWRAADYQILSR